MKQYLFLLFPLNPPLACSTLARRAIPWEPLESLKIAPQGECLRVPVPLYLVRTCLCV